MDKPLDIPHSSLRQWETISGAVSGTEEMLLPFLQTNTRGALLPSSAVLFTRSSFYSSGKAREI